MPFLRRRGAGRRAPSRRLHASRTLRHRGRVCGARVLCCAGGKGREGAADGAKESVLRTANAGSIERKAPLTGLAAAFPVLGDMFGLLLRQAAWLSPAESLEVQVKNRVAGRATRIETKKPLRSPNHAPEIDFAGRAKIGELRR